MTTLTIPFAHLEIIRRLVVGVLPNVQNSSLFSATAVASLAVMTGTKRERNAQQDAEMVRRHCILLCRSQNMMSVSGTGIYGSGTPISWRAQWEDEGNEEQIGLDPQGLFSLQDSDMVFSKEDTEGPVSWAVRELNPVEGRRSKGRVRRLNDADTRRLVDERFNLAGEGRPLRYDLIDDLDFFRTMSHMTSALDGSGFWQCSKWGEGEDARLTSSWDLGESSFGFMDMLSTSETIPSGSCIVLSQGNMKTMGWIIDRFKDTEITALQTDGEGNHGRTVFLTAHDVHISVTWQREQDAVSHETQETAIARNVRAQGFVRGMDNFVWTMSHPIAPLVDGLSLAATLCPPVLGREEQAGVRVSVDVNSERPTYVFRARNSQDTLAFRIGVAEGGCSDLPRWITLTPGQAKMAQTMLRTLATTFVVRNAEIYLMSSHNEKKPGMLMIRGRNGVVAGGIFSTPIWAERMLTERPVVETIKETPHAYVDVKALLDIGKTVLQLGALPALARGKSSVPVKCTLEIEDFKLRIETGSDNHVAGGYVSVPEKLLRVGNGARMSVRVFPLFLQSALTIFEKVLLQTKTQEGDKLTDKKVYVQVAMGGGEGLYLCLQQGKTIVAQIRTSQSEEPYWEAGPVLGSPPAYTRLSPHGQPQGTQLSLPETRTLKDLAVLHQTFGLEVPGETVAPSRLSLTGMQYVPEEGNSIFRAADTHRAVRAIEPKLLFGDRPQIIPAGFFTTAALLKEKQDETYYTDQGSRMELSSRDLYVVWEKALPVSAETLYPTRQLELMLQQKMAQKPIDEATGLVTGLGSPGHIKIRLSKNVLAACLHGIESNSIYGRVAWIWEKNGQEGYGYLLEDDSIGDPDATAAPLIADVLEWETPKDHYFICIGRKLLESSLAALMQADEDGDLDVTISIASVGIQLTTGRLTSVIMPMNLREKEQEYLTQVRNGVKVK